MLLGPIVEVIVYVRDMQKQVEFYRDQLGLEITFPQGLNTYNDEMWVTFNTGPCVLALHGGAQGDPGTRSARIVFHVENIVEAKDTLNARGVTTGDIRVAAPGIEVCDGTDPEGNKFSIESRE